MVQKSLHPPLFTRHGSTTPVDKDKVSINKENFITSNPTRVETLIIFADVSARVEGSRQLFKEGGKGSESGEEGEGEGGGGGLIYDLLYSLVQ